MIESNFNNECYAILNKNSGEILSPRKFNGHQFQGIYTSKKGAILAMRTYKELIQFFEHKDLDLEVVKLNHVRFTYLKD